MRPTMRRQPFEGSPQLTHSRVRRVLGSPWKSPQGEAAAAVAAVSGGSASPEGFRTEIARSVAWGAKASEQLAASA
jgi:hypothetical protein